MLGTIVIHPINKETLQVKPEYNGTDIKANKRSSWQNFGLCLKFILVCKPNKLLLDESGQWSASERIN